MIDALVAYNADSYMQTQNVRPTRGDPKEMFDSLDKDGSGGLSESELSSFAATFAERTGMEINTENAISEYDQNGDGELNGQEMREFMKGSGLGPPGGMQPRRIGGMGGGGSSEEDETDEESSEETFEVPITRNGQHGIEVYKANSSTGTNEKLYEILGMGTDDFQEKSLIDLLS